MKLSVLIPCYNERDTLLELIGRVAQAPVADKQIILIDDGSTDGTTDLIRENLEQKVDKVVYHSHNLGKTQVGNR